MSKCLMDYPNSSMTSKYIVYQIYANIGKIGVTS